MYFGNAVPVEKYWICLNQLRTSLKQHMTSFHASKPTYSTYAVFFKRGIKRKIFI